MIMLRCTFHPGWCEHQEGQEPCENKAQHNPCLLNPWIIVAGLAGFALAISAQPVSPPPAALEIRPGDDASIEIGVSTKPEVEARPIPAFPRRSCGKAGAPHAPLA